MSSCTTVWVGRPPAPRLELLSPVEVARWEAMASPNAAREYASTRCWARRVLGHWLCVPPDQLPLRSQGPEPGHGPLELDGWHLSLAHSRSMAVLGLSRMPIGVDVEHVSRPLARPLARLVDAQDRTRAAGLDQRRSIAAWTSIEALAKCAGTGLQPGKHRLGVYQLAGLPRHCLSLHGAGDFLVAVALDGRATEVHDCPTSINITEPLPGDERRKTMWSYEHSVSTDKSADQIWQRYLDPARWPEWDKGLERVEVDGPLAEGTKGTLTPKGQPAVAFEVSQVDPGKSFTDRTQVNGLVIEFIHRLASAGGRTIVTHAVTIDGPGADQAGPQIGPRLTADIPASMAELVASA